MKYKKIDFSLKQVLSLIIFKTLLVWFPESTTPIVGKLSRQLRYLCCRSIFLHCGKNVNIEKGASFGSGFRLCIGDNSGIGVNCHVPGNIIIGKNVMMGPNCYILSENHSFDRLDIPMIQQGSTAQLDTVIEDDVWIGREVIFTPGRVVKKGSIIAAGCVLSKNFEEYSIIGGNPSILIKTRLKE